MDHPILRKSQCAQLALILQGYLFIHTSFPVALFVGFLGLGKMQRFLDSGTWPGVNQQRSAAVRSKCVHVGVHRDLLRGAC
jgi:hypothetical protein